MNNNDGSVLVQITTVPQSLMFLSGQPGFMKARGLRTHAISSPGEYLDQFVKQEQVTFSVVNMTRSITPKRDLIALAQLWQHLRRIKPRIVHAHTPKGGLLSMMAAWLARIPVRIYHIHGLPLLTATGYKRFILRWTEKVTCRLAHRVFCVSHSIRTEAIREGLCSPSKITVLLNGSINGIDTDIHFNHASLPDQSREITRDQYAIPPEVRVIGFVGRIARDKGMVELSDAWKILRDEFPDIHLLMVGPFEAQDPIPADVADLLQHDARIHHVSWIEIERIPEMYAAMDIVALPTYREGFPTVSLEAAAMELPIVATRVPGCIDAVEDGITGILIPPYDPEALADALRTYLNDPSLRHEHGQAARQRVLRDFRPEPIWEALYEEYTRLLQERSNTTKDRKVRERI